MLIKLSFYSGYMAPEYALHGKFSVKSDIYSFGVLLLEMVSGQKNSCFQIEEDTSDLLTYVSTHTMHVQFPFIKNV